MKPMLRILRTGLRHSRLLAMLAATSLLGVAGAQAGVVVGFGIGVRPAYVAPLPRRYFAPYAAPVYAPPVYMGPRRAYLPPPVYVAPPLYRVHPRWGYRRAYRRW